MTEIRNTSSKEGKDGGDKDKESSSKGYDSDMFDTISSETSSLKSMISDAQKNDDYHGHFISRKVR